MLSSRGAQWSRVSFLHGTEDAYDPTENPHGTVMFTNAENWFMRADLTEFVNTHNHFDQSCVTYGEGYTGTLRLRTAMAKHLNTYFQPNQAIDPEEITFAAGVTSLNEICALLTCDANTSDSILLGRPIYGPFSKDLALRTGVTLEYASVGDVDQFSPACAAAYEAEFEAAKARGSNIKAMVITNPHNPLGQCYPRETLVALLRLCAAKGIHLFSDEIYGLSIYDREGCASPRFTSVRAIDYTGIIDPRQVHVLYGMSKDYSAAGFRLGCIITQNTELSKAARAICRFSSPSQFSMDLASKFLEDQAFVAQFLEKSQRFLLKSRLVAEELLDRAGIKYFKASNAGLFLWLDLAQHLPLDEANGDGAAAERILSKRFTQAGVIMDAGSEYGSEYPGRFRLVFTITESTIVEGIKRISAVLSK